MEIPVTEGQLHIRAGRVFADVTEFSNFIRFGVLAYYIHRLVGVTEIRRVRIKWFSKI